jgi:hypothetical protein
LETEVHNNENLSLTLLQTHKHKHIQTEKQLDRAILRGALQPYKIIYHTSSIFTTFFSTNDKFMTSNFLVSDKAPKATDATINKALCLIMDNL